MKQRPELVNLNMTKKENLLSQDKPKIGTALKTMLGELDVCQELKKAFLKECTLVAMALVSKLMEQNPLRYTICRNASSLSPIDMTNDKDVSIVRFKHLTEALNKKNLISADEADEAQNQYEAFVEFDCKVHRDAFLKFDFTIDRVDAFLGKYLHKVEKYKSL